MEVKTAVMDVIRFLCVSLGSSTVQLHDSLGSRRACACSEAVFSSQNVDRDRLTIDKVVNALGCAHSSAYSIMHDRLKFRNVCARWIQRTEGSRKYEPNRSVLATSLTVCR
jgi:hypothetical protein